MAQVGEAKLFNNYKISRGDCFSVIAKKFGVSINQLKDVNPQIKNINIIKAGDLLNIPGQKLYQAYIVKKGDNLSELARNFGTKVEVLTKLNKIKASEGIDVNQILVIPKQRTCNGKSSQNAGISLRQPFEPSRIKTVNVDEILVSSKQDGAIDQHHLVNLRNAAKKYGFDWQEVLKHIQSESKKYNMDTNLILSVIYQESKFDPKALSPCPAYGFMQLTQITVDEIKRTDKVTVNPHNWRENISGGIRYLSKQMNRFGDIRLALAAYNAGPTIVAKHNKIPNYTETKNYVVNILDLFYGKKLS